MHVIKWDPVGYIKNEKHKEEEMGKFLEVMQRKYKLVQIIHQKKLSLCTTFLISVYLEFIFHFISYTVIYQTDEAMNEFRLFYTIRSHHNS